MGRSDPVSLIQFVLSGGIPPLIKAKEKNRRKQERINADPKLKARRAAQRADQRKKNPDSHEREKATAQVRMCGNSVCPPLAAALVRANVPELAVRRIAA